MFRRLVARVLAPARPDGFDDAGGPGDDPGRCILWLLPGHLGDPLDLPLRTLRLLRQVDVVLIEAGTMRGVRESLARLDPLLGDDGLGEVGLVEVDGDLDVGALLDDHARRGRDLALFGGCDGLPTLVDPGWRVVAAARARPDTVHLRTAGASSALAAALLLQDVPSPDLRFLGLLRHEGGRLRLCELLDQHDPAAVAAPLICFATSEDLHMAWPRLRASLRPYRGRLLLLRNLTHPDEDVVEAPLSELGDTPPGPVRAGDKVVLRLELSLRAGPAVGGFWRRLRRPV